MIHKAFNRTEIAYLYYKEKYKGIREISREQAYKNFMGVKHIDYHLLANILKKVIEEQRANIDNWEIYDFIGSEN